MCLFFHYNFSICSSSRELSIILQLSVFPRCVRHNRYAFTAPVPWRQCQSSSRYTSCEAWDKPIQRLPFHHQTQNTAVSWRPLKAHSLDWGYGVSDSFGHRESISLLTYLLTPYCRYGTAVIFWLSLYCAILQLMLMLLLLLLTLVIRPHQYVRAQTTRGRVINTIIAFILHRLFHCNSSLCRERIGHVTTARWRSCFVDQVPRRPLTDVVQSLNADARRKSNKHSARLIKFDH